MTPGNPIRPRCSKTGAIVSQNTQLSTRPNGGIPVVRDTEIRHSSRSTGVGNVKFQAMQCNPPKRTAPAPEPHRIQKYGLNRPNLCTALCGIVCLILPFPGVVGLWLARSMRSLAVGGIWQRRSRLASSGPAGFGNMIPNVMTAQTEHDNVRISN